MRAKIVFQDNLLVALLVVMLLGVMGCESKNIASQETRDLVATGYVESFIPAGNGGEGYSYCSIVMRPVMSQERLMFPHVIFGVDDLPKMLSSQKVYQLYRGNYHGYTIQEVK